MKPTSVSAFGSRLIEAFKGVGIENLTGIANELGVQNSAVTNYVQGRIPPPEMLTKISDSTNCSIHWLVTGKGPKWTDDRAILSLLAKDEADAIIERADDEGLEPSALLQKLVIHGLGFYSRMKKSGLPLAQAIARFERLEDGNSALDPGQVPIYFGPYEQQRIKEIADADKRSFEQAVRDIVLEELKKRGMVGSGDEPSNVMFFGEPVRAVELPLMGWIAAGEPLHLVAQQEKVRVPDFMMKPGKTHFVLHVRGDSMVEDHIPDGSLIVCEARNTATDGERVVAVIDGERATVKRIYHEADRIRLQPANPLHKPIYLERDQQIEIQGVVVAVFHK